MLAIPKVNPMTTECAGLRRQEWDDAVFALICVVTVELLWTAYQSNTMQNIRFCIDQSVDNPYSSKKMNLFFEPDAQRYH